MLRRFLSVAFVAASLFSIAACRIERPLRSPDPGIVQAYSGGALQRHSTITVVYALDRANAEIGAPLRPSPISFSPHIAGTASWRDARTLEFKPSRPLQPGRSYRASVGPGGFDFRFTVLKPDFQVDLAGLESVPGSDGAAYILQGTVATADVEEPGAVERILRASLRGLALPLSWTHDASSLFHTFRVAGIGRAASATDLELRWSGKPIGAATRGESSLRVPSSSSFEVLEVRAAPGDERYLELTFSDPLETPQDFRGLVTVREREDLRYVVSGNKLKLYAATPWRATEVVSVARGVKSGGGKSLDTPYYQDVPVADALPQVRFLGNGVIVPTTQGLTVPIETLNLSAVVVEAFRIYGDDVPQFLQVNRLDETRELYRVGTVVWRKVLALATRPEERNVWVRHGLDLSPLVSKYPDGLFELRVSFRPEHLAWPCGAASEEPPVDWEKTPIVPSDEPEGDQSYWDWWGGGYDEDEYANRRNPCHPAYYRVGWWSDVPNVLARRNIMVSNIGLMAKAEAGGAGQFLVYAADLRSALPLSGVQVTLLDFQRQKIASGLTDREGAVVFRNVRSPSFVLAERRVDSATQYGYLRVDPGSALVTSHFDVSGETGTSGVRGFIYGERGVWRPGDDIYLTFILNDPRGSLPASHPVVLELRDPRGQISTRMTRTEGLNGFYAFRTGTSPEAPTGAWEARVKVGDLTFTKMLRIETVMPNRLTAALELPEAGDLEPGGFSWDLRGAWLHGAPASNLSADVKLALQSVPTAFPGYPAYVFDDPARAYAPSVVDLYEGTLDSQGRARVDGRIDLDGVAPGKLAATFAVRVFEPSGVFSTEQFTKTLSPYPAYVGILTPPGDERRGMLLVDQDQSVSIVMLTPDGRPVSSGVLKADLLKLGWRWWWESGDESLAEYVQSRSLTPLASGAVEIRNGRGEWTFQLHYPEWGRYLLRVTDESGGHSTGKVVYMDWPGWAGRARGEGADAATMLTLTADEPSYQVGDEVSVSFPSNPQSRALVLLEKDGRVVRREWVTPEGETTLYRFTATEEMTPNMYVHVTFLQPHLQTANDLPIRMYGIAPVLVEDARTHLRPLIDSAEVFAPGQTATVAVREATGREMTYTLALVDEGLLRITRYGTPDPWNAFYKRVASLVTSWDLYDLVAGAYAGRLENLLAIGGAEDLGPAGERKANRFPPLVRFIGPVALEKGGRNIHTIELPQYVGAVRVMVVAASGNAYGTAEREVAVKSDLMVLGTLPRVMSVTEEADLPITVFAYGDSLRNVTLNVSATGPLAVVGSPTRTIPLGAPPRELESLVTFRLRAQESVGVATVRIVASSGPARAEQTIELDVRMPGYAQTLVDTETVPAGRSYQRDLAFPGIAGTNTVTLEVSRIVPLDLGKNLEYLVRYPHGCIEQTTSAVFPQLSLDRLARLEAGKSAQTQRNIVAGIERLKLFQTPAGGFAYWPGEAEPHEWATTYAGHFLLEARARGFTLPPSMLPRWQEYQRSRALQWGEGEPRADLQQAYRLFTLALSGAPEIGAMNRLRELRGLTGTAKWVLAASYQLAGLGAEARRLTGGLGFGVERIRELSGTFGSELRDRGMILYALSVMGLTDQAESLARDVSRGLEREEAPSTQTIAYALLGLMKYGLSVPMAPGDLTYSWAGGAPQSITFATPVAVVDLPAQDAVKARLALTNSGGAPVYTRVIMRGMPPLGAERASASGLSIDVQYRDSSGETVDPAGAKPGKDLSVTVSVRNLSRNLDYEQLALTYLLPGGWELLNQRLASPAGSSGDTPDFDYQDIRDDRVYTYFGLIRGQSKSFSFTVTPAYGGRFYLPAVQVEAMYDPTINARTAGRWLEGGPEAR